MELGFELVRVVPPAALTKQDSCPERQLGISLRCVRPSTDGASHNGYAHQTRFIFRSYAPTVWLEFSSTLKQLTLVYDQIQQYYASWLTIHVNRRGVIACEFATPQRRRAQHNLDLGGAVCRDFIRARRYGRSLIDREWNGV